MDVLAVEALHRATCLMQRKELLRVPSSACASECSESMTGSESRDSEQPDSPAPFQRSISNRRRATINYGAVNRWQYQQQRRRRRRANAADQLNSSSKENELAIAVHEAAPPLPCIPASPDISLLSVEEMSLGYSKEQLDQVGLLLTCYRQHTVYILGGTRIGIAEGASMFHAFMLSCYRFLGAIAQPVSMAWNLPNESAMEIVVRAMLC